MPKITYTLLLMLIVSLAINVLQYIKYDNDMMLNAALCNCKASSNLYSMQTHNDENLYKILKYDLVQLVYDYNEDIFQQSKVLSSICKDWEKIIRKPIKEYLDKNRNSNITYYDQVKKHFELLEIKCGAHDTRHRGQ